MNQIIFQAVFAHYPELIRDMDDTFTSHDFILHLAQLYQAEYIEPKWVELGWITRRPPRHCQYFVKPVYTYSITPRGKTRMLRMEIPRQRNTLTFKPGVNREAMIKRIPYFNNGGVR